MKHGSVWLTAFGVRAAPEGVPTEDFS
eukprot:COSAG04_NODE_26848_length_290_cov_0.743455_1_plen_26_part_01